MRALKTTQWHIKGEEAKGYNTSSIIKKREGLHSAKTLTAGVSSWGGECAPRKSSGPCGCAYQQRRIPVSRKKRSLTGGGEGTEG